MNNDIPLAISEAVRTPKQHKRALVNCEQEMLALVLDRGVVYPPATIDVPPVGSMREAALQRLVEEGLLVMRPVPTQPGKVQIAFNLALLREGYDNWWGQ